MGTRGGYTFPPRPTSRHGFTIAILCALPLEADAVEALFDVYWDEDGPPFDKAPGDPNAYSTGVIGRHNIVLAHMPGIGRASAASVASYCKTSFPNIALGLVVGICGVVAFYAEEEIVLGDVIISDGVVQYDFGRQLAQQFERKDTLLDNLGRPSTEIRAKLAKLRGLRGRKRLSSRMANHLDILQQESQLAANYPGKSKDRLFKATYEHVDKDKTCDQLECHGSLLPRQRLQPNQDDPAPSIHFGLIASGDMVMKSGEDRDRIAKQEGVIAFEMEGAGAWDSFPCVVIKGACDYADSHKNKGWQRYAAATAAACMKGVLEDWEPSQGVCQDEHNLEYSMR